MDKIYPCSKFRKTEGETVEHFAMFTFNHVLLSFISYAQCVCVHILLPLIVSSFLNMNVSTLYTPYCILLFWASWYILEIVIDQYA